MLYVDDQLIGKTFHIMNIILQLKEHYPIVDLGEPRTFLGMLIERNRPKRTLTITQPQYTQNIVKEFNMAEAKPVSTPLNYNLKNSIRLKNQLLKKRIK